MSVRIYGWWRSGLVFLRGRHRRTQWTSIQFKPACIERLDDGAIHRVVKDELVNPSAYCANGHQMPIDESFCRRCGQPRPTDVCSNGHGILAGDSFCRRCGERRQEHITSHQPSPQSVRNNDVDSGAVGLQQSTAVAATLKTAKHRSRWAVSLFTSRATAIVGASVLLFGAVAAGIAYAHRSGPSTAPPASPLTRTDALADIRSCGGCQIVDLVTGLSSSSGPASLIAVQVPDTGSIPGSTPMRFYIVGDRHRVIWSAPSGDPIPVASTDGLHFTVDKSGNALMPIVEGAHGGQVVIIRVTPNEIKDYGTLTTSGSTGIPPFESNSPPHLQPTPSGYDEIVLPINNYQPDYANGTTTDNIYSWSTSTKEYVLKSCQVLDGQGAPEDCVLADRRKVLGESAWFLRGEQVPRGR